ncbi:hypothetical protein JNUCC0626_48150 [Lentzea sp. JNUCC 0626]|uniref:hypothetical protein n=1 Tax=Lentzea sp. JNUCC 0626 TaxID=3367513 RepID=UPI00374A6BDF
MHNIIIDGESLPYGTHSVAVWWPDDKKNPSTCIENISGRPANIDTGILFPSDARMSFWAETGSTCWNGAAFKCLCGVVLRDSDPMNYRVRISPPR